MRHAVKVPSTARLIAVPALISIGVTALRLEGELLHWAKPLVNSDVCGKAILGVVWLVPIFGIYFAVKLFHADNAPQHFARAHGFGHFGIGPQAYRNIRDGIPRDQIRSADLDELHRYPDRPCPVRHGVADALQSAAGLWIPISNSDSHRPIPGNAWPLGHALRCLGSRISFHWLLANVSPRFLRPEHLFHGGLYGDCRCAGRDRCYRSTRAGQTGSVGDSSLGNHRRGQGHDLADVESAVNDEPSRRLYSACDNSGVLKDPCHRRTSERVLASPGGGRWRRVGCAYALGFDGGDSQVRAARAEQGGSGTGSTSHSDQLR